MPLRPTTPADRPDLLAIAVATGLFTPADAEALLGGVLDSRHSGALDSTHTTTVWAPEDDAAPAGWSYAAPDAHADGVWNLWWIGVMPDRQGEGGGVALLHRAEDDARAAGARLLIVETSALEPLARTREFYRRQGYEACGTVPHFYGPGDGKVIFAKPLSTRRD